MQNVGVVAFLALACVVAVSAAELYAAEDVSEAQYNLARDGSAELNGDSPVRQAQRARRDERVQPQGVSLMETAAGVDKYHGANGPALNRLTGAAKTFHPNDQMCVMCQFLVQRVQLDMAHFNVLGGFLGVKSAGAGGKDNAAAGGDNAGAKAAAEESSFLEIASAFGADDASKDWEAEDAEDAAAMELAAKQELAEADGNWDAVAALEAKSHAVVQAAEEMAAEDAEATGDEDESEEEDEEVEEDGAEFEEEDSEHAVAQQLAASSFAEAGAEVITSGLTAVERREMEEVMAEMRDDRVAESVNKQLADGMETTPVMVEAGAAAKSDDEAGDEAALGDAFEHELDLSADEKEDLSHTLHGDAEADSEFTTPSYNADGQSESSFESDSEVVEAQTSDSADEDMALLQVAEEESAAAEEDESEDAEADAAAEEELEGMADNVQLVETAANPHAPRSYARTLHVADADAAQPVLAEMSGTHASFHSNGGLAQVYTRQQMAADAHAQRCYTEAKIVSRVKKCERIENTTRRRCKVTTKKRVPAGCGSDSGSGRRVVGISNSPRRFRLADALHSRPRWNRWDPTVKPHPDPARAKAREMWHHLMQMTYDRLEGYCSTRLPEQFTPFCRPLLRRFRVVAEGIRYGDRPNQICMRTRFCPRGSYVRRSPHNVFKHMKVGF